MTTAPVALVTGGGRRLGAAISAALAGRGYRVAVHCRVSCAEGRELAARLGGGAWVVEGDLAEPAVPAQLIRQVHHLAGRLDLLVNSAASFERTPMDTVDPDTWDRIFATNLRAPFFLAREAARVMGGGSSIINLADLAGEELWRSYLPHSLAKAGLADLTRALARDLAPRVRVNAIAPGVVLLPEGTPDAEARRLQATTPLQRHGTADDVVRAVEYLLDASFVTGEVLFVDGGRRIRH